jgi:hypothetical protein
MTAAGLTERDPEPEVPRRDDDAARQGDVRLGEVAHRTPGSSPAVTMHLRTIAAMSDDARNLPPDRVQLTLEQVAQLLPGTGEIMRSVGECWWKCAYAARGGNWPLAAYFARRVRSLQRNLAVVRPKYADDLAAFESEHLAPVLGACESADRARFDPAFDAAVEKANDLHVKWAKAYIRWTLPPDPPADLDLGS